MKLDPTKPILDLDGEPIQETIKGVEREITVAFAASHALLQPQQGANGETVLKRFTLAKRLHDADGPIDITSEEAVMLKEQVLKTFAPLIYGRIDEMIEGK